MSNVAATPALSIGDRSYGIIPVRFVPSVANTSTTAVTTENSEVLLIHQKTIRQTIYPSFWCFPKGHAEVTDASIKHTAIRELEEETALKVDMKDLLEFKRAGKDEEGESEVMVFKEVYVNPVRSVGKEVRYWVGLVRGDQKIKVQEREVAGAMWVTWEEALNKVTFEECRGMLRAVIDVLDGKPNETYEGLKTNL